LYDKATMTSVFNEFIGKFKKVIEKPVVMIGSKEAFEYLFNLLFVNIL
jgi:hypothetical protein